MRGRCNRGVARYFQCDWKHESQVIVGVFADQVHASGCAINRRHCGGRELRLEFGYDLRRNESQSRQPPNTKIIRPHQRLTLLGGSSGARAFGFTNPYTARMAPRTAKRMPVGRRRSSMSIYQKITFITTRTAITTIASGPGRLYQGAVVSGG